MVSLCVFWRHSAGLELKFRNNKWIGLTRQGRPFVVHIKHGGRKKYPPPLVEAVAKDLDVSHEEFLKWYRE